MKAVVFTDIGSVEMREVPPPELLEPTDALVRVTTAAICGSDLHVLHGKIPGMTPGSIMGHECVGVVEAVGDSVTSVKPGDRVVASFQVVCGTCWYCRRGDFNLCTELRVLGYGLFLGDLAGCQAELARVPLADYNLMKVPPALTDEQVLFAGDILATGFYAAKIGEISSGDTVCVMGAGPVGAFAIVSALRMGAARVIAVDMVDERLELVAKLGAEVVNSTKANPVIAVEGFTEGRGADVVIDAVGGGAKPFLQALDIVRPGGTVVVIGVHSDPKVDFPMAAAFLRGVKIVMGGSCNVQGVWHEVLELIESGEIDPTTIISHTFPLADALKGYELFESRKAQKVILKP